jgi:1-aminocyclopropane-1-carboxylate deaminase
MIEAGELSSPSRLLPKFWWQKSIAEIATLAPIHSLPHPVFTAQGLSVDIKREDLLCPFLGGNKLYKLHFHLHKAIARGANTIATFGGPYSNHVYALARVGCELGIKTIAVIRGEEPKLLSPTLQDVCEMGMELRFVSRQKYALKHTTAQLRQWGLVKQSIYLLPEGGGDLRGALGVAEYWRSIQRHFGAYDTVVLAAGTGASMAGVMAASSGSTAVQGILVLKGSENIIADYCRRLLAMAHALRCRYKPWSNPQSLSPMCWQLYTQFHLGGYGPAKPNALPAITALSEHLRIPLDPVYTGKLLNAVVELARQSTWPAGRRLLVLHTGGIQGARPCRISQD